MPIGRAHHVIYDCPDPVGLAQFYAALLGLPITYRSADFVVVARDDRSSGFAFQLAPDHRPPDWPDPRRPQQVHLDVMVDDLSAADREVRSLGARRPGRVRRPRRPSVLPDPAPGLGAAGEPIGRVSGPN